MKLSDIFKKFNKNRVIGKKEYYDKLISINDKNVYSFNESYTGQEDTLYGLYGKARVLDKHINIIVITDTHNMLDEEKFKSFIIDHSNYDVCLLLGDFGYKDIPIILRYIDKSKIYALLGNHDSNYISEFGFNNLNGNIININGVRILGIEGSFRYKPVKFPSFSEKESIIFLNDKEEADILVSHDRSFDSTAYNNPAHQGLFGITYYLYKNRVPYHIHGHIHNPYRKTMINGTKEISSYMYEYIQL